MKGDEGGREGEISEKGIDMSREAEWKDSEDKKKVGESWYDAAVPG